jgi:hypothetical protein
MAEVALAEISKASYSAKTRLLDVPESQLLALLPQLFTALTTAAKAGLPQGNVRLVGDIVEYVTSKVTLDQLVHALNLHDDQPDAKAVEATLGPRNLTATGEALVDMLSSVSQMKLAKSTRGSYFTTEVMEFNLQPLFSWLIKAITKIEVYVQSYIFEGVLQVIVAMQNTNSSAIENCIQKGEVYQ